jgi:hypothetical protein
MLNDIFLWLSGFNACLASFLLLHWFVSHRRLPFETLGFISAFAMSIIFVMLVERKENEHSRFYWQAHLALWGGQLLAFGFKAFHFWKVWRKRFGNNS